MKTAHTLSEAFAKTETTKAMEITTAAHFLFVNLQFFLAPVSLNAAEFQIWAKKYEKEMKILTQDLKISQDETSSRDCNILGEFFKALKGNPLLVDDHACLLYADFKPLIILLNNAPLLLSAINKHLYNPIIDQWFKETRHQEHRELCRKKITDPLFIQKWPQLLQDILTQIDQPLPKNADLCLGSRIEKAQLVIAARLGDEIKVKALLEAKACPDQQNANLATALTVATSLAHIGMMQLLLTARAKLNIQDGNRRTAFTIAASLGHIGMIQLLLAARAELNSQDGNKHTALMTAARKKQIAAIRLLVTAKAKLNIQDQEGNTAIMMAIQNKDDKTVIQLLPSNLDIVNKKQQTPVTLALQSKSKNILALLINHIITKKRAVDLKSKIKDTPSVGKQLRDYSKLIQNTHHTLYQLILDLLHTQDEDIDSDYATEEEEEYDENTKEITMAEAKHNPPASKISPTKETSKTAAPLMAKKKFAATSLKLPLQKHRWTTLRLIIWQQIYLKQKAAARTQTKVTTPSIQLT